MRYFDLDIKITPVPETEKEGNYTVSVLNSRAGEGKETIRIPNREQLILTRQPSNKRGEGASTRNISPTKKKKKKKSAKALGKTLFNHLFSNSIEQIYRDSVTLANVENAGLRIKLRLNDAPQMARLPWEFMYDDKTGKHILLSNKNSIVRYPELHQVIPSAPIQALPLNILGLVANAPDLDVDKERSRIDEALAGPIKKKQINLSWLKEPTWQSLQKELRQEKWHIFHYIGHGKFDKKRGGLLALNDEDGGTRLLSADELGRFLTDEEDLKLVILNSCEGAQGDDQDIFSSMSGSLVQQGVPAILAMQYEISDGAAIEFARSFYDTLSEKRPIETAVAEARKSVSGKFPSGTEWGTAVLHMRSPDGNLFDSTDQEDTKMTEKTNKNNDNQGVIIEGDANVTGDIITGNGKKIQGDNIESQFNIGSIKGENVVVGNDATINVTNHGSSTQEHDEKKKILGELEDVLSELSKSNQESAKNIRKWLDKYVKEADKKDRDEDDVELYGDKLLQVVEASQHESAINHVKRLQDLFV